MDSIINFFQWIADLIQIVFDFVINAISMLLEFLGALPQIITFALGSLAYLPDTVGAFALIGITVSIVLLVLGRSNNG